MAKLGNGNSQAVTFANNGLTGAIPSEIGKLGKLKAAFYLYSNNLCDDIPAEVAALSSSGMCTQRTQQHTDQEYPIFTGQSLQSFGPTVS